MNPVIIGQATLYHADCIEVMAGLAENILDAIIEDYFAIAEARVAHVSPDIVEVKRTERSVPMKQQASLF